MIVAAIPPNIASNSNGNIPRIVVPDAIATGTIRLVVALTTASSGFFPILASKSICSTSTIAFLIFMPINPSNPRIEKKSNDLPSNSNPNTIPMNINGNISKITVGLRYVLNRNSSVTNIKKNVNGRFLANASLDSTWLSCSPKYFIVYPSGTLISFCTCDHTWLKAAIAFTPRRGSHCAIITICRL